MAVCPWGGLGKGRKRGGEGMSHSPQKADAEQLNEDEDVHLQILEVLYPNPDIEPRCEGGG